ncbi:MAG TPA: hypothetical protein DDY13_01780 [Cytophagales bacterium]|jgi:tetratricopeptide (TPR) repeat protein|nr:hypothetical protein [Cytophagales bacterium]
MNSSQFKETFLPKELVLELSRDFPDKDIEAKIELIKSYAAKIGYKFDADVFEILLNKELGICRWEAGQYSLAITHFEQVIHQLPPNANPTTYFLVIGLLIRCNTLIADYDKSLQWAELAMNNLSQTNNSFDKLSSLVAYADLVGRTNRPFAQKFIPLINEVINELGFPETLNDPNKTIDSIQKTNTKWNKRLSEITLTKYKNEASEMKAFEEYRQQCPVGWYRNYAGEKIEQLKNMK